MLGLAGSGGQSMYTGPVLLRAAFLISSRLPDTNEPRGYRAHKSDIRGLLTSVEIQELVLRCAASGRRTSSCRNICDAVRMASYVSMGFLRMASMVT